MSSTHYFDSVAERWDQIRKSFFSDQVREKALSLANVEKGRTAVDVGAGTGFITEGLIQRGLHVIAVDQSEMMLAKMRKKFARVREVDYRLGKAEKLPISGNTVDYVFANMCLHHVENPREAVKEMVRILKPRGRLVITDLDEHSFRFLKTEHQDRWMGFKRRDVEQWFKEAGLKDVLVDCVGERCCAQSDCGGEYADVSIFVAVGEK